MQDEFERYYAELDRFYSGVKKEMNKKNLDGLNDKLHGLSDSRGRYAYGAIGYALGVISVLLIQWLC